MTLVDLLMEQHGSLTVRQDGRSFCQSIFSHSCSATIMQKYPILHISSIYCFVCQKHYLILIEVGDYTKIGISRSEPMQLGYTGKKLPFQEVMPLEVS